MSHPKRGLAIIINNKEFEKRTLQSMRMGSDVDVTNLEKLFTKLGFDIQVHRNKGRAEMVHILDTAAREDHSNSDCFACAILSHGDSGLVYGTDGSIDIDTLVAGFKGDKCISLAGKPKLFFIQACRGDKLDHGVEVSDSSGGKDEAVTRIPTEADFLMAYSTVPGYYSWRNGENGSWFIQAMDKVFSEHGTKKELMELMTMVNHTVAYEFDSRPTQANMHGKKQVPAITTMLTKLLYFTPKVKLL